MFRTSNFDKLLDQTTNSNQLEIKWDSVLQLCDYIRQGDVQAKDAVRKIIRKITNSNQHTAEYGLYVLDASVKNCGHIIQSEISTREFMEQYKDIIEKCPHENVKTKALDMLQNWAHAFRNVLKYRPVNDTMNILKHEGYKFPVFKESEAMFSAEVAPDWKDSDRCHRCKTEFTLINRKHHCRACGEVFCRQCSDNFITLPQFGIEKEVRVCINCHDKNKSSSPNFSKMGKEPPKKEPSESPKHLSFQRTKRKIHKSRKSSPSWPRTMIKTGNGSKREELPSEYLNSALAQENQNPPPKKSAEELKEEEELQLALAISESEMESKRHVSYRPATRTKSFSPPITQKMNPNLYDNEDPELARYLNRTYWDNRATSTDRLTEREVKKNTATINPNYDLTKGKSMQNNEQANDEIDKFMNTLRSQVEIFVNRMKSNSSRGRSISNDSSVQSLFMNITAMHSQLLRYIQQQDDSRVYYEGLQDKLTQVKDARAALDALRQEHRERLRREAEIAERQRHLQMAQKLETMRQQKQEYLQYQRQLAIQRIRDQEREMQMRQEQQKQQYRLATGPYGTTSYMAPSQGVVSAFEPVGAIAMNMNGLPSSGATVSYGQASFPNQYPQGQPVNSVPSSQQQMVPQQPLVIGQSQMPSTNSYVPGRTHLNTITMVPTPQNPPQGALGPGLQPPTQYSLNQPQSMMHPARINLPTQHLDSQNPHAMIAPPSNTRVEPNTHIMGPPTGPPPSSMLQHPNAVRPMMPPSSSPLSSPSSSSEHSIIQHGPQPMPSAPSANSTPQPEECKEEVAELISFD